MTFEQFLKVMKDINLDASQVSLLPPDRPVLTRRQEQQMRAQRRLERKIKKLMEQ